MVKRPINFFTKPFCMRFSFLPLLICLVLQPSFAQQDSTKGAKEKDVIDVVEKVLNKSLIKRDTITKKSGRIYFGFSLHRLFLVQRLGGNCCGQWRVLYERRKE